MEQIVDLQKKLSKKKHRDGNKIKTKKKLRNNMFENQLLKLGTFKLNSIVDKNEKQNIANKSKWTTNHGLYAKSIISKIARKHDVKYEEFKGRINCDLKRIIKTAKEELSGKNIDPVASKNICIKKNKVKALNKFLTPTSSTDSNNIKYQNLETEIVIGKIQGKINHDSTDNIHNYMKKAFFIYPICTIHSYLRDSASNLTKCENNNDEFSQAFNTRFKFYLDKLVDTINKVYEKLNVNVTNDIVMNLRNIHAKYHCPNKSNCKLIINSKTKFPNNSEDDNPIHKKYYSLSKENGTQMINNKKNILNDNFESKINNANQLDQSFFTFSIVEVEQDDPFGLFSRKEETSYETLYKKYPIENDPGIPCDLYEFRNSYANTFKLYDLFDVPRKEKVKTRSKFEFDTPEYKYQKMNV